MDRKTSLLITFALGALAGAAVGYFVAGGKIDDIGAEAEKLKDELNKNLEKGKQIVDKLKDTLPGIFNETHES